VLYSVCSGLRLLYECSQAPRLGRFFYRTRCCFDSKYCSCCPPRAALGFCGWILWFALSPIELAAPTVEFLDRAGSTLRGATRQIIEAGLPMPGWKVRSCWRSQRRQRRHQGRQLPGIGRGNAASSLVRKIMRGEYAQAEILFVEGWSFSPDARGIERARRPEARFGEPLGGARSWRKLGAPEMLPEGMFFPDTYVFAKGSSGSRRAGRARRVMKNNSSPPGPDAPRICR